MSNLQNIPIRDPAYRDIRRCFTAPSDDYVVFECDLSQIELRTLAQASGCPVLTDAYLHRKDMHTDTAEEVCSPILPDYHPWFTHWEKSELDYQHRQVGKTLNFGVGYGASPTKVWEIFYNVGIVLAMDTAERIHHRLMQRFARVESYRKEVHREVLRTGSVRTLFGRLCLFPGIREADERDKAKALRDAFAIHNQGTAADILKGWLILIAKEGLIDASHQLCNFVHDSIVGYCPRSEVESYLPQLLRVCSEVPSRQEEWLGTHRVDWTIPIVAEAKWGSNWIDHEGEING